MRMLTLIALLALAAPTAANAPDDPARQPAPLRLRTSSATAAPDAGGSPVVVHTAAGREAEVARELTRRGLEIVSYLPESAFLVLGDAEEVADIDGVVATTAWTADQAMVPELRAAASKHGLGAQRDLPVVLAVADPELVPLSAGRLELAGASLRWQRPDAHPPQLGILVPPGAAAPVIAAIAQLPGLVWAELQPPPALVNDASAWRCQSGQTSFTPIFDHGLLGEGQVIAIADTGIDVDSCYFFDPAHGLPALNGPTGVEVNDRQRKVLAVDFLWDEEWPSPGPNGWDTNGHGTHVAGSVAGDRYANRTHDGFDGMAPAARLVVQDAGYAVDPCGDLPGLGCPMLPLEPVLQQAYDQGARIHSNSYGDEEDFTPHNRYTERTADMDRFVWSHKDFLITAAAGNDGPDDGTVISPSTGKNVMSIAATRHGSEDPTCVAGFSSRGPTHDGRIKPDVAAPGSFVRSAANDGDIRTRNCLSIDMSGTSMATPTVAGLAALVRQYYADGFYPGGQATPDDAFSPSAALVKATLIASAVDLSTLGCEDDEPIPSRDQGWGMVQLDNALAFSDSDFSLLVEDRRSGFSSTADDAFVRRFVLGSIAPLKVVLVWTDPPSTSAAAVNLVNDLDLELEGPDGLYLGNVFAGGVSQLGGVADRVNNVEVVSLSAASPGAWTLRVRPAAVVLGEQDFAVVVTGDLASAEPRRVDPGHRRRP